MLAFKSVIGTRFRFGLDFNWIKMKPNKITHRKKLFHVSECGVTQMIDV